MEGDTPRSVLILEFDNAAKDAELRSAMPNLPFDVVDDVAPLEAAVPSGGGGGKSRRTD